MLAIELLLLLIVFGLVIAGFARQNSRYKRYPPGPFAWPFLGNIMELQQMSRRLGGQHEALLELSRRYESPIIGLSLGNSNTFVVSGSESINEVMSAEEYIGRPWNYFIQLRNMGKKRGITMNDGEDWRNIRHWFVKNMKAIGFASRNMTDSIKEELLIVINDIQDGGIKIIKPIIVPIIMNVLWIFIAGKRFNKEKLQYFINLMERRAQAFDMTGGILSTYPWIRFIAPEYSGYNLLVTINNEFKEILMETIEEHKRNYVSGSDADLIDMFLNEMYLGKGPKAGFDETTGYGEDENEGYIFLKASEFIFNGQFIMDKDQLIIILLDILVAGLNITATTLDFLFLNMLINQNSQKLVHEEIDRVIGHKKVPDFSDIPKMPYVQATIIESQRIVPVVPIIGPRRVLRDTKLLEYDIPKDSFVLMNLHSIHVDPKLYPEPYSFKPDRFLKDGMFVRDDNLFFFGKGKRQCPGISLAKTSLFLIFASIMQHYELLPVPGDKPPSMQIKVGLTMAPQPYDVLLKPRI